MCGTAAIVLSLIGAVWCLVASCCFMQRKECSHGESCMLARNALEYWLHPDK